ncbi:MAG: VOC family protein [Burkholderiaceae bacterium]|uniref:VOC family protein n=1 Tax=Ottowia sp. TaxID=1898956 RepID=UPI0025E479AC|nr:VOC family protein [Ottowia sp.]
MNPSPSSAALDHLVVLVDTLAQGVAWCETTLGVTPAPGGEHALFGTHNRLLAIGGPAWPRAYLEIIAVDPAATPARRRWFDLDDAALREAVRVHGPRLIHWVARVPELAAASVAWAAQGLDAGDILAASRMTPRGLLQWRIAVRADGRRLLDGCAPTLIEWGAVHPAASLPASGVTLQSLGLRHPQAAALQGALAAIGVPGIAVAAADAAAMQVRLATPRGELVLDSGF